MQRIACRVTRVVSQPVQRFHAYSAARTAHAHALELKLNAKATRAQIAHSRHAPVIDRTARPAAVMHWWGYDLAAYIVQKAGMPTAIAVIDNPDIGIQAEYIEVMVSRKF